jgi:death-on-curing protein
MRYLSAEEILRLHYQVIKDYGGSHGIRDEARIQSLVEAPKQGVFGHEQYVSIFEKAAVYLRNIIADHLFVDGNKRTGVTVMAIFLARNGYSLRAQPKALEDFAVRVATDKLEIGKIADWLQQNTDSISKKT